MTTITILDTSTQGHHTTWSLDLLEEKLSLRELIRRRIYQEVTEYNAHKSGCFHGLVQPTDTEPHERSWWQILWQLARGQTATQIAETTAYSRYWIGQIARRYNQLDPTGTLPRLRIWKTHNWHGAPPCKADPI